MSNLAFLQTQPTPAARHAGAGDNPFWCPSIGSGCVAIAALAGHIDVLSQRIAELPVRAAVTRPVVGQYLSMIRTLAACWQARSRPALAGTLDALALVGASLEQAHAQGTLDLPRKERARMADAVARRLAAPAASLATLDADLGSYLAQMARASGELECDTALVTERVQSDAVHAFLLSQQASALQSRLDDANVRQRATWLLGPHAQHVREEITLHGSALEGVRRQLAQLQAEQSATRAEADYLQGLLPSLSTYLAAFERMGAAIAAAHAGTATLRGAMQDLVPALAAGHAPGTELAAALPHWAAVAQAAAKIRMPDATRT